VSIDFFSKLGEE